MFLSVCFLGSFLLGCQYQFSCLSLKTCRGNNLVSVERHVQLYSLTQFVTKCYGVVVATSHISVVSCFYLRWIEVISSATSSSRMMRMFSRMESVQLSSSAAEPRSGVCESDVV